LGTNEVEVKEIEENILLNSVIENVCQPYLQQKHCSVEEVEIVCQIVEEIIHKVETGTMTRNDVLMKELYKYCERADEVLTYIEKEQPYIYMTRRLKGQVRESRKLVAEQLKGVSKVMENFSNEIRKERENHRVQEEQILQVLRNFGVRVNYADIYSLEA